RESDLLPVMNQIVNDYPQLKLSSLPHLGDPPHIEFSLRGEAAEVEQAMQLIKQAIDQAGFVWTNQLIQ
ncbi:competence/damage-inducible protein A, partial [Methylophaga sp. SB9B]